MKVGLKLAEGCAEARQIFQEEARFASTGMALQSVRFVLAPAAVRDAELFDTVIQGAG